MPIRERPLKTAAPSVYALIEAVDRLPEVLQRASGAFDLLSTSAGDMADRIGTSADALGRLQVPHSGGVSMEPGVYRPSFDPSGDDMLTTARERLVLEQRVTDALHEQAAATEILALGQERAARQSGKAWDRLSDDIVGDFDNAFAGVAASGAETFSGLWTDMAAGLSQAISAIDWDGLFGRGAGRIASITGGLIPSGGGSGLFDIGASLLSSFLPSGGGAGIGGTLTSLLGGGGSFLPVTAIATAAAFGLNELFKDEDYPFAKAVIGVENGSPAAESAFELDGGPLDELLVLQDRVIETLDAMSSRIGAAFSGSAANFLQIGYSSGRKSSLPSGYFVGGLETTGDFASGADLSGIETEEEVIARAIELAFAKALRDGNLGGFPNTPDTGSRSAKTFSEGLGRLLAAPFEDLETSLRRIDFLASFEETVALYRDGAESLDTYNRSLQQQRSALDEAGRAAATEALDPIRLFLQDAALLFGSGSEGEVAETARLDQAGRAVRGMTSDLLEAFSLSERGAGLEGFALLYEQQKAQIAALVPGLESLNRELAALGLETVNITATVNAAYTSLTQEVQSRFIESLEDSLSPGRPAARQAVEERDSLLRQAEQLGLGGNRGVLARIERVLVEKLDTLGFALDASGALIETFANSIEAATAGLERQITTQESAIGDIARLAESLRSARDDLALDGTLSPHSPLDRLAQAQSTFTTLAAASAEGDIEAREELAASAREYLSVARDVHASGETYTEIFHEVDRALAEALDSTEAQISTAERQLDVLLEIRDRIGPATGEGGALSFRESGGGQYVSEGGGPVGSGYDLGYRPERAVAILTALDAAGLPLPSGFGEGQLARLRQENAAVDAVVSAMGFAEGGIMSADGPQSGGIALGPSVSIFGEGSLPEAYVPLPDGRTIPVTLSLPANDGPDRATREAMHRQHADSRELVREMKRLNSEVAALRDDNERLSRLLGRALSRRSA
ncbi:hypothetical protein NUH88_08910 [Nisaea acidiphila]|uniref:Uncharacterized protein n=1 Tax=Nisaea acidiphila TaxID=1862145 RepID=A0A9J7AWR8_9PROT|nr:hypothetical protein [Nisaea acidiphila]UUX51807.1 hypothetical protein NUH88_08910 [Nisaea acidiphila]